MRRIILFAIMGLLLTTGSVFADVAQKEKAAVAAAERWLEMIDEGKYDKSWQEAASYFKGAISSEKWQESLNAVRKPLGKKISRKVKSTSFRTSLPGAPDAEYVVIEFSASFQNKKSAIETVTPMKEKNGSWRVSGYYIQ